jgi:hypothetical protein
LKALYLFNTPIPAPRLARRISPRPQTLVWSPFAVIFAAQRMQRNILCHTPHHDDNIIPTINNEPTLALAKGTQVTLERDGQPFRAQDGLKLVPGDVLKTTTNGATLITHQACNGTMWPEFVSTNLGLLTSPQTTSPGAAPLPRES